jgi:hypothetical protein
MKVNGSQKMERQMMQEETLIEKIRSLRPERIAEVEDFVDFLRHRDEDRRLVQAAAKLSENAFHEVWDNTDDADYDCL